MVGYFLQQCQLQNPELMLVMMLRKFPRFLILSMSWPMIFMDHGMDLQVIFNSRNIKVEDKGQVGVSKNSRFFFKTDIFQWKKVQKNLDDFLLWKLSLTFFDDPFEKQWNSFFIFYFLTFSYLQIIMLHYSRENMITTLTIL